MLRIGNQYATKAEMTEREREREREGERERGRGVCVFQSCTEGTHHNQLHRLIFLAVDPIVVEWDDNQLRLSVVARKR